MENKIILVEDDLDLGQVVKQYLEFSGFLVHWFNNPTEFLNKIEVISQYDLIILDVMMPETDGFTLSKIVSEKSKTPFLFMTAKAQSFDRVLGLKLGAEDYITKPCDPEELLLRIRNILKRNSPIQKEIIQIGKYDYFIQNLTLSVNNQIIQLTEKEAELLNLFIKNNQRLISRKEILESLWGENDYFLGRSLDVFMTRLRKYFNEDETIKFESVRGIGYKIDLPIK